MGSVTPTPTGRTIAGRYRVMDVLGQGGAGRVYMAEQVGLDRRVALKVIRPERREDPDASARFLREARAAGRISSPNVVTLYDSGHDSRGDVYIAMELLEGRSLAARMRRGEIAMIEAVQIGAAIARGLAAAHEAGVVHRDLKPANVFLCSDGSVKVLDFGIAKIVDEDGELTNVARVLGTPTYMSPEAARRSALGPGCDLYALGVLLFEMIAGKPPFSRSTPQKTMLDHVKRPAPRLAAAAPWVAVPPELDALVAALLEKDPAHRPNDAAYVARELDTIALLASNDHTVLDRLPPAIAWEQAPWEIEPPFVRKALAPRRRRTLKDRVAALGVAHTVLLACALGAAMFTAVLLLRWLAG